MKTRSLKNKKKHQEEKNKFALAKIHEPITSYDYPINQVNFIIEIQVESKLNVRRKGSITIKNMINNKSLEILLSNMEDKHINCIDIYIDKIEFKCDLIKKISFANTTKNDSKKDGANANMFFKRRNDADKINDVDTNEDKLKNGIVDWFKIQLGIVKSRGGSTKSRVSWQKITVPPKQLQAMIPKKSFIDIKMHLTDIQRYLIKISIMVQNYINKPLKLTSGQLKQLSHIASLNNSLYGKSIEDAKPLIEINLKNKNDDALITHDANVLLCYWVWLNYMPHYKTNTGILSPQTDNIKERLGILSLIHDALSMQLMCDMKIDKNNLISFTPKNIKSNSTIEQLDENTAIGDGETLVAINHAGFSFITQKRRLIEYDKLSADQKLLDYIPFMVYQKHFPNVVKTRKNSIYNSSSMLGGKQYAPTSQSILWPSKSNKVYKSKNRKIWC